jgi:hypothetical protein
LLFDGFGMHVQKLTYVKSLCLRTASIWLIMAKKGVTI